MKMREIMNLLESLSREEYWAKRDEIDGRARGARIRYNIEKDEFKKTGDAAHQKAAHEAVQAFRAADREMAEFRSANPEPGHSYVKADAPGAEADQGAQADTDDYRGQHQAPDHEGGAPLWDLTGNGVYPDDIYQGRARDYADDPSNMSVMYAALNFQGRPNAPVTIYRSMPKDVPSKINVGDWVALSKRYARDHGHSALNGNFKIVQKTVRARDIFTAGDSIEEWGYDPQPVVKTERGTKPRFGAQG